MWPSALGVLYIERIPSYPTLLSLCCCFFFFAHSFWYQLYVSVTYGRLHFLSFGFKCFVCSYSTVNSFEIVSVKMKAVCNINCEMM